MGIAKKFCRVVKSYKGVITTADVDNYEIVDVLFHISGHIVEPK